MSLRERFLDKLTVAALVGSVVTAAVVVRREVFLKDPANSSPSTKAIAVDGWKKYVGTGRLVGNGQAPLKIVEYPAARAAECAAQQGRFAAYHDILFDRFDSLSATSFNDVAAKAGVPNAKAFSERNSQTDSIPRINSDRALALDTLHISGTPTVIVNGMMYAFAPPLGELRKMVKGAH